MAHPLEEKLAGVRQRAKRLWLLHGASWVAGCVIATAIVLGLLDWTFRWNDFGLRLLASGALWGLLGYTAWRFLREPLLTRLSNRAVAAKIERRYPQLSDQLISTVDFLEQREDETTSGSPALRRAVVAQTISEVEQLDLADVIDARPATKAAWIAAAVGAVALILALVSPLSARIALGRLAFPFASEPWPQHYHLTLEQAPDRVARGQAYEVRVTDPSGTLPGDIEIEFLSEGAPQPERKPMLIDQGAAYARKEAVLRPFKFRATGGDDFSMPWHSVTVVDPPDLESYDVELQYPAYTGLPASPGDRNIQALIGTQVKVRGRSTKPLAKGTLRFDGGTDVPATVSEGRDFTAQFVVEKSGSYSVRLEDTEGLIGGQDRRYEVRAITDETPTVNIEQPANNVEVTARAIVPVRVVAKDDLALRDVQLSVSRSEEPAVIIPLFRGPEMAVASAGASQPRGAGDRKVLNHQWQLGPHNFQPGDRVAVLAVASDYKPQTAQSLPRYLQIVTPEQLFERLGRRQGLILEKLDQVMRLEQDARRKTDLAKSQWDKFGKLDQPGHDDLQGAELTQRQVDAGLTGPTDSVLPLIRALLADLENNGLDDPEMTARMKSLAADLEGLAKQELPAIRRELTNAVKSTAGSKQQKPGTEPAPSKEPGKAPEGKQPEVKQPEAKAPEPKQPAAAPPQATPADPATPAAQPTGAAETSAALSAALAGQDKVIATLQGRLDELARWDDARRFRGDISGIEAGQRDLAEQAAKLLPKLVAGTPEEREEVAAEWHRNLEKQKDLANQLDRILPRMEEAATRLQQTDRDAAGHLRDALTEIRERGINSQMRAAAKAGENKQAGQTAQLQRKAAADLKEVLDVLSNRREQGLERLVRKLKEAESQLAAAREKQAQLQREREGLAGRPDSPQKRAELERLTRREKQLAADIERLARQLQRLDADRASAAAEKGAKKLEGAAEQGDQGQAENAEQQAKQAGKDLDEAQQALAERRQQAEMDLAFEQLMKIKDALTSLVTRQGELLAETKRLDALRKARSGQLTSGQRESVKALGGSETALQREVEALSEKLSAAEVFRLALRGAAGEMEAAADYLAQEQTDKETQRAETNALRRFEQLVAALEPVKDDGQNQPEEEQGGQGGGANKQPKPPGDGVSALAQLRMLRALQVEVNNRTKELDEAFGSQPPTPAAQREYARLSEEQGRLADLVRNLVKPTEAAPEDAPPEDALPKEEGKDAKEGKKEE